LSAIPDFQTLQRIKHHFIDIAPTPLLTGLKRFDDRVRYSMKMLRGVSVGRRVAATYVATDHAKAKMQPLRADAKTVFAAFRARCHRPDLIKV
jgi:hypothetical protein